MEIKVTSLGLAAYVHGQNEVTFLRYESESRSFVFSVVESRDFEKDYLNCCCSRHDSNVMALRRYMGSTGK